MRRATVTVMALMSLALVGVGAGTWYELPRIIEHPAIQAAVTQSPAVVPIPSILLQQGDGNLAMVDSQGTVKPLTTDADGAKRSYTFAVPAPDGSRIAYVEILRSSRTVTSSLVVQQVTGARRTVFDSQELQPFYLHWSPDSQQIAFLSGTNDDMLLQTVGVDGKPAQHVTLGQPSYFAWTPDSHRLLLHTRGEAPAGSLSLWNLGDPQPTPLKPTPAFFRAPVWLPDGQSALVTIQDANDVALARVGADGAVQQQLAHTKAGMVFVLAPNGKQVAYIDMTRDVASPVHLIDSDGHNDHTISKQDAVSFLWSPTSDQLAYLTIVNSGAPQGDGSAAQGAAIEPVVLRQKAALRLRWNIYNAASGSSRILQSFVPTNEFLNLLPYFDQYAQSIRLWDHPGRHLIYADDQGVWSLDVASGTPTKVAAGVLGVWMDR
ncbi:MAG: hypothetical protein H0X37_21875 [Herpetosiphonaceae bacterium]|nr:hypothetical protein [Herpetosiphonaceae bacterium]